MGEATKLNVYDFGSRLLSAGDLDPVYTVLWHGRLDGERLCRWLLGYWCFYHAGTASWVADGAEVGGEAGYWDRMERAAGSSDYPRSSERRHFRGAAALRSVAYLRGRGLESLFEPFAASDELSLRTVMKAVQEWVLFGPWIAFKAADMLERLALVKIDYADAAEMIYASPEKGAYRLWGAERPDEPPPPPPAGALEVVRWALGRLTTRMKIYKAPPRHERPFGLPEGETLLCKWNGYCGGHYHIGEDVAAVERGLRRFDTPTAFQLYEGGREGKLWE